MNWLKAEWEKLKKSGTIILAWCATSFGSAIAVARDVLGDETVNQAIQSLLNAKYVPYYVIASGLFLRYVRGHNATDL